MSILRDRLAVVILTHNRAAELRRTLERMLALPESPTIVVVDNASTDSTAHIVRLDFAQVKLVRLDRNVGAAARNIGVLHVQTPYVAFCDDDTWWAQGALVKATELLDACPQVAVLSARVLVGAEEREDSVCATMAASPLPSDGLPGPALLGFLAGAAVVRRRAFIDAGGYEPNFFLGGEEDLLALDLIVGGWNIVYAPQLTVHHYPSPARDGNGRRQCLVRNAFWVAWMRLPSKSALRETWRICRRPYERKVIAGALINALLELPWVLSKRRVISGHAHFLYRMLRE
jgi:GT2 family glycosyltransferase